MGRWRALYVGIGEYRGAYADGTRVDALPMAPAAAREMADLLAMDADGTPHWPAPLDNEVAGPHLLVAKDGTPVKQGALKKAIARLLSGSDTDHVLLYFAGHGRRVGPDGGRLLLATSEDLTTGDESDPASARGVWADELVDQIRAARPDSATLILDCCHAGAAAGFDLPPNVVLLAACEADQEASYPSSKALPQFTGFLLEGLREGARDVQGRVTPLSLFTYVAGIMGAQEHGQVPIFKGQVRQPVALRWAEAQLGFDDLRRLARPITVNGKKLPAAFPPPGRPVQACGDWEATKKASRPPARSRRLDLKEEDKTPEQLLMDYYNRLRRAGLVKTTDDRNDLFWTVMASIREPKKKHGVALTELGRYYWRLSKNGDLRGPRDQ